MDVLEEVHICASPRAALSVSHSVTVLRVCGSPPVCMQAAVICVAIAGIVLLALYLTSAIVF